MTFSPVADSGIEEIICIQLNFEYGKEESRLEDVHFIPKKVAECISKYKNQLTLDHYNGYQMKNVEMDIMFRTKDSVKNIVIGNEIYSYGKNGMKYRILNGEKFRKELFEICGVPLDENDKIIPKAK